METEKKINRELHQATLRKLTELSAVREETGLVFKATAKAVSPHVDEIKVEHPNGSVDLDFIEET